MANPFLIGDTSATFTDNSNTFNPFLTNTTAELESHNDNPFFSTFNTSNSAKDNTNPFLAFTQKPEPAQPVADLLGINEKPQTAAAEDTTKTKPPPPRPAPPKRPPPRPTPPPSHDAKELILSVTGEMDATSSHLLDRLAKTPSPTPMRDLLSPSPTPTADLLGCEDLQPPVTSQASNVFDQQTNIIDFSSGPKPERPKFPPKIDFLMDDLLEDVPINEGIHPEESFIKNRTPSIPENQPIVGGSKPESRKSSNEFIPSVRRLSHDVTESRKIMPDLSKIADRRKSDIGHFAPILPSKKPTSQSDQTLQERKSESMIQEISEPEEKPNIEVFNNVVEKTLITTENTQKQKILEKKMQDQNMQEQKVQEQKVQEQKVQEQKVQDRKVQENIIPTPPKEIKKTNWDEEKNGLDFDSQQQVKSSNQFEIDTAINKNPVSNNGINDTSIIDTKLTPPALETLPLELKTNESFNAFGINETLPSSESFPPFTEKYITAKEKPVDAYDMKPIPPVPDSSPFQEISSQDTSFNAVFEVSEKTAASPFDVQEPQQLDNTNTSINVIPELLPEPTVTENDAFDAFAAKFDDSQSDCNATGFDAFGSVAGGGFEDSSIGFGADDNFDSFLSTHQIPAAPQSTPAKVTRNNSGESLDENDFNVFIRYLIFKYNTSR